jgi:hypothetical protein
MKLEIDLFDLHYDLHESSTQFSTLRTLREEGAAQRAAP